MKRVHLDEEGRILLTDEILEELKIEKGEEVVFFEKDGFILVANAKYPAYSVVIAKPKSWAC
jgi:bifunctional DNA-binding transcriptional regulator/antitoxin component of YhaV-PrlF toxin-antitoxin module